MTADQRLRDLVGYGRDVPVVEWPDSARLALNVVVNYEEGSERTFDTDEGQNEGLGELSRSVEGYRDLATESVYEYGSRAGIFRILRILDEFNVPATFFAAAQALEHNPQVCEWIRQSGHEVCGHGYRWSEDWTATRNEEKRRLTAAIDSIARTCGQRPVGWYNRWMASSHTRELLVEEGGFLYDSNAYNDDLPYWSMIPGGPILVVPYTLTYNDVRYAPPNGLSPSAFVDYCIRGMDELAAEGESRPRMMSIGLHPRWTGQAARASALREILGHAKRRGDVWFARRDSIAEVWMHQHPNPEPSND